MPLQINPANVNQIVDLSETINVIPNSWGLFNQLGIFETELKSQKTVMIPRTTWDEGLIPDRNWDERNNASRGPTRSYLTAAIPHFPLDDSITPNDIDGKVAFDLNPLVGELETVAATRARKMMQIRMNHALTLEAARAQLITTGSVYAPSGTLTQSYGPTINWYNEFGVTRTNLTLPLNDDTANPLEDVEAIIASVQDGLRSGAIVDRIVAVASPAFFNALITHPYVTDAYKYYAQVQGQQILNARLTAKAYGLDARYRTFDFGGVLWIEYRGGYTDRNTGTFVPYIPVGEAYAFPQVSSEAAFKTYFAPANRFDTINRVAQEAYFFEKLGDWQDKIEIMTESNFMNAILRPQALVRITIEP
jgi:hypothetical protein